MENIIIRNIQKEDIESVVDINIEGWQTAYRGIVDDDFLDSIDRDEKIKKRQGDYNKSGFIVAELNNEIVGFCRYTFDNRFSKEFKNIDCEIAALYVKPKYKYKGIGTKLVEYVKNEFRKNGKKRMLICCLKDNEPSKKFYSKMGGTITQERTITIGGKDYQEVCFEYFL